MVFSQLWLLIRLGEEELLDGGDMAALIQSVSALDGTI